MAEPLLTERCSEHCCFVEIYRKDLFTRYSMAQPFISAVLHIRRCDVDFCGHGQRKKMFLMQNDICNFHLYLSEKCSISTKCRVTESARECEEDGQHTNQDCFVTNNVLEEYVVSRITRLTQPPAVRHHISAFFLEFL